MAIDTTATRAVMVLLMGIGCMIGATRAEAALQSRAGGQAFYDDVANLTWAAVASQATGSGAATGVHWYGEHRLAVESLSIAGVSGWRVPLADVDGDGDVAVPCATGPVCLDNEMGFLHAANGVSQGSPTPLDLLGGAKFSSASASSGSTHHAFSFDTGTNSLHNVATSLTRVLVVQSGDVFNAGSWGPNLIQNGSFESGASVPAGGGLYTLGVGYPGITSWDIRAASVDYMGTYWEAADGDRSIDVSGVTWGTISQTIPTTTGHRYRVRFSLAGNFNGAGMKRIRVTAADQLAYFGFDPTGRSTSNMGWAAHEFLFIADAASTAVHFVSQTQSGFGPILDDVQVYDLGPEPLAPAEGNSLEFVEVFQFELVYNDSGSGADDNGAYHRPLLPPGFYMLSHQGQGHYGPPGLNGLAGGSVLAVRELEPGALAPPATFEFIWNDSNSGATLSAGAYRPVPPPGYECLGTFISNDWVLPHLSTNPNTIADIEAFRCVRADLVAAGRATTYIWKDQASGGTYDFGSWQIGPADGTGLGVGGFIGTNQWVTPTDPMFVLLEDAVRERPAIDLSEGPYLELKMLRDREVSVDCDWNPPIYNDSGSGASGNVTWWHPQSIPAGFHQLGHNYEPFHNPACSLDPLVVAKALAPDALAPPLSWDSDLVTPWVEPIWTDQGSGGSNNGGLWRPNAPNGYVCLGTFGTGGYGYVPPDHPNYVNFIHPANQAVAAAATNFRCVREDLVVPARVAELGWTDSGSGASLSTAIWEVDPAIRTGADAGIDVGHFVAFRNYRMPLERLATLNSSAVAQLATLTQTQFDDLLANGPKLRLHPNEQFQPDDPIYSLDHDVSLCSGPVPGSDPSVTDPFPLMDAADSTGEVCDFDVIAVPTPVPYPPWILPIPVDLSLGDCSITQPNASPGSYYDPTDPPQCVDTSASSLLSDVEALQVSNAGVPNWQHWLDIDVGALDPVTSLPTSTTGNTNRARAVVRARPWNGLGHEIQYWLWYPYNGPGKVEVGCGGLDATAFTRTSGRHYGDWEVIVLRYDDERELAEVQLSQHDTDQVLQVKPIDGQLQGPVLGDGLQPVLFAAKDSHAHYAAAGKVSYKEPFSLNVGVCTLYLRLNDYTANGTAVDELDLSQSGNLIVASSDYPNLATVDAPWLRYLGRWGKKEAVSFRGDVYVDGIKVYDESFADLGSGPTGPIRKPVWPRAAPEPTGGLAIGVLLTALLARRAGEGADRRR